MKKIALIGVLFFTQCILAAQGKDKIECVLNPRAYVGNVQFDIDTKNKSFKITYDDPRNQNNKIVAVQGHVYIGRKDSMGFDKISLCTGEPCSGQTHLGELKTADQVRGNFSDRDSYFSFNSNSKVQIKVLQFDHWTYITGLRELACYYW